MSARSIVAGSAKMMALASGIVVPEHVAEEQRAAERKSVRWTVEKWKAYRRAFTNLMQDHILLNPHCGDCNSPITVVDLDEAIAGRTNRVGLDGVPRPPRGSPHKFTLRCHCTDRIVVQGV